MIESFYGSLRVAIIVCPLRTADLPESGQLVRTSSYSSMRKYIILNVQWRLNIVCPLRAADLPDCGPPAMRISRGTPPRLYFYCIPVSIIDCISDYNIHTFFANIKVLDCLEVSSPTTSHRMVIALCRSLGIAAPIDNTSAECYDTPTLQEDEVRSVSSFL